MKFSLNLRYKKTFEGNGQALTLVLVPLTATEKAQAVSFSRTVTRRVETRDSVSQPGTKEEATEDSVDAGGFQEFLFRRCVKGWEGVENADAADGKPLRFSQDNLDLLLGVYPEIHNKVLSHLLARNGLGIEEVEPEPTPGLEENPTEPRTGANMDEDMP